MTIDPERVEAILVECLFDEAEMVDGAPPEGYVEAQGILNPFGFHPGRLEGHREEVRAMLDLLPREFRAAGEGGLGGWSFLNACFDRDGKQWTGLHLRMDQLLSLGQALGFVKQVLPRALWPSLPGGMPYYTIELGTGGE